MANYYFDYAAATPLDERVLAEMLPFLTTEFGNPASATHDYGRKANQAVDHARHQIAQTISADAREIVLTSGATESNNLALKGVIGDSQKSHVITSKTEHRAILDVCAWLAKNGCEVTFLNPEPTGEIHPDKVKAALRPETKLVSLQAVNNETGVINPITEIGKITREHGVLLHVDGAQAIGKMAIDVNVMNIDLLSLSSHKVYGPKGIGALYVRRKPRVKLNAQIHGGGHERGMRSGTLPTHQIVGMGKAFELAHLEPEFEKYALVNQQIVSTLNTLSSTRIHGENRVSQIINVGFAHADIEELLAALSDFAIATGSACSSAQVLISNEPSHVLKAMQVPAEYLQSSLRISFGRMTTEVEVQALIGALSTL